MKPSPRLIAAALFLPALAACASQETRPSLRTWEEARWNQLFKLVDQDGDGKVTREEFQRNYVAVTWQYFDKNGDGYITMDEWAEDGRNPERDQWFRDLDADGDGRVSREEFQRAQSPEGIDRFFDLMDRSGDGVITTKDLGG